MSTDNGNKSAFPEGDYNAGLTKREWLAAVMLSGIAGEDVILDVAPLYADRAVKFADALLAALEKQDQP